VQRVGLDDPARRDLSTDVSTALVEVERRAGRGEGAVTDDRAPPLQVDGHRPAAAGVHHRRGMVARQVGGTSACDPTSTKTSSISTRRPGI